MKLYKVNYFYSQYFIIAINKTKAGMKFLELLEENGKNYESSKSYPDITITYICKRDDIIPTVEPIKELLT